MKDVSIPKSFCEQNNIEYKDYIKAAILQTYLRFNGEFSDYFEEADNITVIEFIKQAAQIKELPFEYDIQEDISINFKDEKITEQYKKELLKSIEFVIGHMHEKEKISDVRLISEEEEQHIYKVGTGPKLDFDRTKTWVDSFTENAKVRPDNKAVVDKNSSITYEQLNSLSNIIANYLINQGIKPNEFVALKCKRRKEFIIALTGVNKAGAAYIPVDPEYPEKIRNYIIDNSQARLILDDEKIKKILAENTQWQQEYINKSVPENLAYMIYTSGTTGNPKGVMIRHKSVVYFGAWTIPLLKLDSTKHNLVHSTFSFDASIMDTLIPMIAGGSIYIADEKTRMNLKLMADFIEKNKITGFTTSYSLGRELISRYDLNFDYVLVGGEPFIPFKKVPYRLINGYGPTEFTVLSSVHEVDQDKDYLPPIGAPAPESVQIVVDCFLKPLPLGIPGELCLFGNQIAIGYCNNEEATKRGFVIFDNGKEGYRTGDLVRYNEDNELEFMGRIDRQVKHRGFRIEPAQIENRVLQYDPITECAVVVKPINGIKKLCLYYISSREIDMADLREFLEKELAEYMIPEAYMEIKEIPKTRNGKVDYSQLPEIKTSNSQAEFEAPRSTFEKLVCSKVCEVLNLENAGLNDDFFALGGDSLRCMELVQELDLPLLETSDIYENRIIKKIIKSYKDKISILGKEVDITNSKENDYPLLGAQVHFYKIQEKYSDKTSCNIHSLYLMNQDIEADRLAEAVSKVIKAHGAFGDKFYNRNGRIYQRYEASYIKEIHPEKISQEELDNMLYDLVVPYDIFNEPLYRIRIFETENNIYLFVDFHHLIFDGYSFDVFWDDVNKAYNNVELKEDDFYKYLYNKHLTAELRKNKDIDINPACIMPYDYKEPRFVEYEDRVDFYDELLPVDNDAISRICNEYDISANVFFMGCYMLAMYKQTKENKLSVSWIYSGRDLSFSEECIGLMINLLFVNCDIDETKSISEFFEYIKNQVNESLSVSTGNGYEIRNLLDDPVCCFQYQDLMSEKTNELVREKIELPNPRFAAAFFWEFEVVNNGADINARCVFNNYHYEIETAVKFVKQYKQIVTNVINGIGDIKDV